MNNKVNRRGFLTGAATVLAGCAAPETENEEELLEPETAQDTEQRNTTETGLNEQQDEYNEMEFGGLAESIQEDLWRRGYESSGSMPLALARFDAFDGKSDRINVRVDFNSVIDNAQKRSNKLETKKDQDLYTVAGTDNLDTLYEDTEDQLHEVAEIIDNNIVEFLSDRTVPEEKGSMSVTAELSGHRGSRLRLYDRSFEQGDSPEPDTGLAELEREWYHTDSENLPHGTGNSPMKYEELMYLEEGDEVNLTIGDSEHNLHVPDVNDRRGVVRIDGDLWGANEGVKMTPDSLDYDLVMESTNPMYMENGVEIRFEGQEVDYFPTN